MEEQEIVKKISKKMVFDIKQPKKMIITDPWYFDEKDTYKKSSCGLVYNKRTKFPVNKIQIFQESENWEYDGHSMTAVNNCATVVLASHINIFDAAIDGLYYPEFIYKEDALGCDTAQFNVYVDDKEVPFHTGADGYYGDYLQYKKNVGIVVTFGIDNDMMGYDEFVECIKYVFEVIK